MKRKALIVGSILCLTGIFTVVSQAEETAYEKVTLNCRHTSYGDEVENITFTVADTAPYMGLTPDDFTLSNALIDVLLQVKTEVKVENILFTPTEIELDVEPFMIKVTCVESPTDDFAVTSTDAGLSFTYADIDEIYCPQEASFDDGVSQVGEAEVPYKLYSPAVAAEPLPIVIYNHGGGCSGADGVLSDDSFACTWAEATSQKKYPCYVLAPYRFLKQEVNQDDLHAAIKAIIDGLVEEGKVDANRIYMTGESAGSIYTITFANAYPDYLTAIALMNGGSLMVTNEKTIDEWVETDLDSPWSDAELKVLADSRTSVMFIQGLGDILSTPDRFATIYKKLAAFGMDTVSDLKWVSYTASEFNFLLSGPTQILPSGYSMLATDPITGKQTYTSIDFHTTSRVGAADTQVKNWLMSKTFSEEPVFVPAEDAAEALNAFFGG